MESFIDSDDCPEMGNDDDEEVTDSVEVEDLDEDLETGPADKVWARLTGR